MSKCPGCHGVMLPSEEFCEDCRKLMEMSDEEFDEYALKQTEYVDVSDVPDSAVDPVNEELIDRCMENLRF